MYVIYREMILKAVLITVCVSLLNHECNIYFWIVFLIFWLLNPINQKNYHILNSTKGCKGN